MADSADPSSSKPAKSDFHSYPMWCARFWHGMLVGEWFRLAARHKFRIHPYRWPMALSISFYTSLNSVVHQLQRLLYDRRVNETEVKEPPIFILGHWRSGTTYLHELMVLDDRFASPSTFDCFVPNHFLLTEWPVKKLAWWAVPAQRPMDNMEAGWDCPQEDEFALCNMGLPSPYLRCAFPNDPPEGLESLNIDAVSDEERGRWVAGLQWFVRALTFKRQTRLVLKSPPHNGRIKMLLEAFPNARFVHIVRHPDTVVPSTIRLWKALDLVEGMQVPLNRGVEELVFDCYERMYQGFESQRSLVDPQNIVDVRYEELVKDPAGTLAGIYEKLGLGDFEVARPKVEALVASRKSYKTNKHELDAPLKARIRERWSGYIERYGYAEKPAEVGAESRT